MAISKFNSRDLLVVSTLVDRQGGKHISVLFRDKAGCVAILKTVSEHNFKAGELVTGSATAAEFTLQESQGGKDISVSSRVKNTLDVFQFFKINYADVLETEASKVDRSDAINLRTSYTEIYKTLKNIYKEMVITDEETKAVMDSRLLLGQKHIDKRTTINTIKTDKCDKERVGERNSQIQENAREIGRDIMAFGKSYNDYEEKFKSSADKKGQCKLDDFSR